ncbi:rhomboid-domain-containing protein [Coprinellus micaceus]|uniref:Rhomboid-domain-containing protein n=1 Tax=Coprinellus micaceus TaxID=71717 RepID=A0A4Y7TND1_COPMI|nr:rhomboid-domain-containing protein [Coprinellus micaceus]
MASTFLSLGLRRAVSALRASPIVRCTPTRTFTSQKPSFSPLPAPSRVLRLLTQRGGGANILKFPTSKPPPGPKTFFTSSKQSIKYPAHPHPPPRQSSNFFGFLNKIPHNAVFYGIISLNAAVFTMWLMAQQKYKLEGDAKSLLWMFDNFTSSWRNLLSGRVWVAMTACFSHKDWSHILFNGFTFFFMAPLVLRTLGSKTFIFLYIGAGLTSCAISLLYDRFIDHRDVPSHGASGAICGVVSFLACLAPTLTFQLYGIIPVPAWLAALGLFGYDMYSTYTDNRGGTDTVGHIGGMLSGAAYYLMLRRTGRIMPLKW